MRSRLGGLVACAGLMIGTLGVATIPAAGHLSGLSMAAASSRPAASRQQTHTVAPPRDVSWAQEIALTPSDSTTDSLFGVSVAADGATAVVGASGHGNLGGTVYVFVRHGAAWQQQAALTAGEGASGDFLGNAVAVSGNTVVAGALGAANNAGSAYIFVRRGARWSTQATLVAPDAAPGDFFGYAVAIDGDTAVVGASDKRSSTGAAYVFGRAGQSWHVQARLTAPGSMAGDQFGRAVAISGGTVIVGAPGRDRRSGVAYIYARDGTGWRLQSAMTMGGSSAVGFGGAVGISGGTAIVGAYAQDGYTGAAYIFKRYGSAWSREATLAMPNAARGSAFGSAVAIGPEIAVIGAPGQDSHLGAAYVFSRQGASWNLQAALSDPDGQQGENYGASIALSTDTALVGAKSKDSYTGTAYALGGPS